MVVNVIAVGLVFLLVVFEAVFEGSVALLDVVVAVVSVVLLVVVAVGKVLVAVSVAELVLAVVALEQFADLALRLSAASHLVVVVVEVLVL
jgi:hypothetical protein